MQIEIGKVIRRRRQELRLTQQALADMSGVSVRHIKAIEAEEANPTLLAVEKIFTPLGLRLSVAAE